MQLAHIDIGQGQENWAIPTQALPIITVPTLAATGSEMNGGAVISNDDTKVKSFVSSDCLYPKVALVDPELTLTVPKDQTAYMASAILSPMSLKGILPASMVRPSRIVFPEGEVPPEKHSSGGSLEVVGVPLTEFLEKKKLN